MSTEIPAQRPERSRARLALLAVVLLAGTIVGITLTVAEASNPNLLSSRQQTFEFNRLVGWRARSGGSVAVSTASAFQGTRSMELRAGSAPAGGTTNPVAMTPAGTRGVGVQPGVVYEGSAWARSGSTSQRNVRCDLAWYRSNGSLLTMSAGTPRPQVNGSWQRVQCLAAAPAEAAFLSLRVVVAGAASGERHYVDEAWLVRSDATSTSAPAFLYRVNTGSSSSFLGQNWAIFQADRDFLGGNTWAGSTADIQGTVDDALYRKHRWGLSGYDVAVPGDGVYTVRLHFAETVMTSRGQRVFDVSAEGTRQLDDLDVFARVGANAALVTEFPVNVVDGVLNLRFSAVVEDPMLSGLEVISLGGSVSPAAPTTTTAPPTTAAPTTAPPTTAPPTTAPPTTAPPTTTSSGICTGRVSGGVPADRFPGAACTGVVAGSALTSQGAMRITQAGSTWTNLDVSGGICVAADNVTIRNSRVTGVVAVANQYGNGGCGVTGGAHNLTMVDVEINAQSAGSAAIEGGVYSPGISCLRCNIHHAGAGINGGHYSLVDTYVHDMIATSSDAHIDGIQGGGAGGSIAVIHSNIEGTLDRAGSNHTGGGVSCAICFYADNSFWGMQNDLLVQNTRIQSSDAVYCAYGAGNSTNTRFIDNTFVRESFSGTCGHGGPRTDWVTNAGDVWSGNRFHDGVPIP